jgi:hypothetical protein
MFPWSADFWNGERDLVVLLDAVTQRIGDPEPGVAGRVALRGG